jgi:hypothetical protein
MHMLLQLWQHVSEIATANMGEVVEREENGNTNEHDQSHLHAGFPELFQPLCPTPDVVDVSPRTRNRPSAIHRFSRLITRI